MYIFLGVCGVLCVDCELFVVEVYVDGVWVDVGEVGVEYIVVFVVE